MLLLVLFPSIVNDASSSKRLMSTSCCMWLASYLWQLANVSLPLGSNSFTDTYSIFKSYEWIQSLIQRHRWIFPVDDAAKHAFQEQKPFIRIISWPSIALDRLSSNDWLTTIPIALGNMPSTQQSSGAPPVTNRRIQTPLLATVQTADHFFLVP